MTNLICFLLLTNGFNSEKILVSANSIGAVYTNNINNSRNYVTVGTNSFWVQESATQIHNILTNKPAEKFICLGGR